MQLDRPSWLTGEGFQRPSTFLAASVPIGDPGGLPNLTLFLGGFWEGSEGLAAAL